MLALVGDVSIIFFSLHIDEIVPRYEHYFLLPITDDFCGGDRVRFLVLHSGRLFLTALKSIFFPCL